MALYAQIVTVTVIARRREIIRGPKHIADEKLNDY